MDIILRLVLSIICFVGTMNSFYAQEYSTKNKKAIKLYRQADEDIKKPTVTIAGASATVTRTTANQNTDWTAKLTVVAGTTEGAAAISITATDLAGNVADAVTATTNDSSVTVDVTAPTVDTFAIASNNANDTTVAGVGDTVTITITMSEACSTAPTVSYETSNAANGTFANSATISMTSSDQTEFSGTFTAASTHEAFVKVTVNSAEDPTGNTMVEATKIFGGSVMKILKAIPTITLTDDNDQEISSLSISKDFKPSLKSFLMTNQKITRWMMR